MRRPRLGSAPVGSHGSSSYRGLADANGMAGLTLAGGHVRLQSRRDSKGDVPTAGPDPTAPQAPYILMASPLYASSVPAGSAVAAAMAISAASAGYASGSGSGSGSGPTSALAPGAPTGAGGGGGTTHLSCARAPVRSGPALLPGLPLTVGPTAPTLRPRTGGLGGPAPGPGTAGQQAGVSTHGGPPSTGLLTPSPSHTSAPSVTTQLGPGSLGPLLGGNLMATPLRAPARPSAAMPMTRGTRPGPGHRQRGVGPVAKLGPVTPGVTPGPAVGSNGGSSRPHTHR